MGLFDHFPYTNFHELNLMWILQQYKKLTAQVETLNSWMATHKTEYAEAIKRLTALENEINTFEARINKAFDDLKAEQQQQFNNLVADIDRRFAALVNTVNQTITELQTQVANEIARLRIEVKTAITTINDLLESNNEYILEVVENKLQKWLDDLPDYDTLMVLNPVRGYRTSIQIAINDLYSYAAVNAITAREFDELRITAIQFDNLMITAGEFDRNAKERLGYKDPRFYMISPFTGENVLIKEVVRSLAALHMNAITAIEFDTLAITAEEFDTLAITAYNFDWNGKAILI